MKIASRPIRLAMMRNSVLMLPSVTARMSAPAWLANTPPCRTILDAMSGAMTVPSELNACDSVRRKCEPSGRPSSAASGLAATWSCVMPAAMTNSATSTSA